MNPRPLKGRKKQEVRGKERGKRKKRRQQVMLSSSLLPRICPVLLDGNERAEGGDILSEFTGLYLFSITYFKDKINGFSIIICNLNGK